MLLLISFPFSLFAQNKTITGTVRDAIDVVVGASVTVKGNAGIGTITDMNGNLLSLYRFRSKNWWFHLSVMIIRQ